MEDGVVLGRSRSNKDQNRSAHSEIQMLQRQAPSSSYNNVSRIPTNKYSRLITKQPHKIRIIHIIPPEIIQTDKSKFKELVQRLTGRSSSAANTGIKNHQMPKASTNDLKMSYLLGLNNSYTNSSEARFSSHMELLDDTYKNHEQLLNLDIVASDHETLIGGVQENDVLWNTYGKFEVRNAKVEKEEMMVQAADDTEWGIMKQEQFENGFCIDGFLELDEWLSQAIN